MTERLVQIIRKLAVPLVKEKMSSITKLIKEGETTGHEFFRLENITLRIVSPEVLPTEYAIFKWVSLKTERSRPNSGRNAVMFCLHYVPFGKSEPFLLLRAEIDFNFYAENPNHEMPVNFNPFAAFKTVLVPLLKHRIVFSWAGAEDFANLHLTPEELAINHIQSVDLMRRFPFEILYSNFGNQSLMMAVWTYCCRRIQDIDTITTDMSFGYDCISQSAGIMFLAIKLQILSQEYEESGYTINRFLNYKGIIHLWLKGVQANVLNLSPIRLAALPEEEAQNIQNNWTEFQQIVTKYAFF